jgi:hypothetical protein
MAIAQLQRFPIVQLFETCAFLGPGGKSDVQSRDHSFAYSIRHGKPIDPRRYDQWYPHPGYAWAMHRSAFNAMGGLAEFCVVGSGDLHFAFALLNRIDETIRPNLHDHYRAMALTWGGQLARIAANGERVGYLSVNLFHFWHGNRQQRSYVDRW